jgi:hypothetical protein
MKDLGAKSQTYRPPLPKAILNMILVMLGAFGLAMFVLVVSMDTAALVIAGAIMLLGVIGCIVIARRQIGRSVTIHEQGIATRSLGQRGAWRYDELDDVILRTKAANQQGAGVRLAAYEILSGGQSVITIGSSFPQWREVGGHISQEVLSHTLTRLRRRIAQGETVTFDRLKGSGLATLAVSQKGLQIDNETPIPWAMLSRRQQDDTFVPGAVRLHYDGDKSIAFDYYNSPQAVVASLLIQVIQEDQHQPPQN